MAYLGLIIKGCFIGIANIIPGVSGGTMAVVLGIYERLIHALHSIDLKTAKRFIAALTFKKAALAELMLELRRIDLGFLVAIAFGALAAIAASAKLMVFLLAERHDPTYGFFWGLVLTSIIIPLKMLSRFSAKALISLLVAAALTVGLTMSMSGEQRVESEQKKLMLKQAGESTAEQNAPETERLDHSMPRLAYLFVCGAVAISAMILPGISGSFVFLLLGVYFDVLRAINQRDVVILATVGLGCGLGLLAFTRLLNYVLERHRDLTIAFLIGLMLGSLYGIWPFRTFEMVGGERIDMAHVLPTVNSNLFLTIATFLLGCGLILIFYVFENQNVSRRGSR